MNIWARSAASIQPMSALGRSLCIIPFWSSAPRWGHPYRVALALAHDRGSRVPLAASTLLHAALTFATPLASPWTSPYCVNFVVAVHLILERAQLACCSPAVGSDSKSAAGRASEAFVGWAGHGLILVPRCSPSVPTLPTYSICIIICILCRNRLQKRLQKRATSCSQASRAKHS